MRTIVVAEDDAELRRALDAALTSGQHRVFRAHDGAKAWALIKQHRPDLAILDVVLPKLSGIELLRMIRADPGVQQMRVLAVTRLREPEAADTLRDAGADQVFVKPFLSSELRAAISRALGE